MTARAFGVFALVLAMASPALAGPKNSVIGAKKLEQDMVHSGGVGYPSMFYEWWNKGKNKLDWGLAGELVYGGQWTAATTNRSSYAGITYRGTSREIAIGLGVNGILRWHLAEKERPKVTNDVGIMFKPGILIGKNNYYDNFTFGLRAEVGAPVSIDVHERVSVVTGGYIPFAFFVNSTNNSGIVPLLVRLGVEIKASENIAPWFYFDLGPGIGFSQNGSGANTSFAWRIGAGTAFWGVMGKNKNKSDSAATASAE
ncbi:MAG: hypothetical protein WCF10_18950 [Polyangiales bacterium]